MKAIFASKLYRASSRQDKIRAAIANPINSELVLQLRRYLDPEYIKPEYLEKPSQEKREKAAEDVIFDETSSEESKSAPAPLRPARERPHVDFHSAFGPELEDELDEEPEPTDDVEELVVEPEAPSEEPEIESSVTINSCTSVDACSPSLDIDVIRGTLNAIDTCTGVSRISLKPGEHELWIYYNDSVNLNNVMEPVISLLESTGYTQLSFNRLARSNNAIVFEVLSTPQSTYGVSEDK